MITKESLVKILAPWVDEPEEIAKKVLHPTIYLGKQLYIVTQYLRHQEFEVIETVVTMMRYNPRRNSKTFTVEGRWKNGNYYNATFNLNSIDKRVYLTMSEAQSKCNEQNLKLLK